MSTTTLSTSSTSVVTTDSTTSTDAGEATETPLPNFPGSNWIHNYDREPTKN